MSARLLFDVSRPGRRAWHLPAPEVADRDPAADLDADLLRKTPPGLPEVSELDLVRHYTRLSRLNIAITTSFYPLGSCTMKYNPVINEQVASLPGFADLHPGADASDAQGTLEVWWRLERILAEVSGLPAISLQPSAGAQGEFTALLVAQAHFEAQGEERHIVLIPDTAHGTNPASVAMAGLTPRVVASGDDGLVDLAALAAALDEVGDDVAAMMITNPNTLGLFETDITAIADRLHACGALLYIDGANLNAILGRTRPGDWGADMMHFNLHKTFSTPHGGGGPGSGPIGVTEELAVFLPVPRVVRGEDGRFSVTSDAPESIGRVRSNFGNFGMWVRALTYALRHGAEGLRRIADHAVLNANYLRARLSDAYYVPHNRTCMHEFVATSRHQREHGVKAGDIAKCLIDHGIHPPTISFPIPEALMIEPTETESKETLDEFVEAMEAIAALAASDPDACRAAPTTTPVGRLDEVRAVRSPCLCAPISE